MEKKKATLSDLRRREALVGWLFVTPVALGILIFQIYPTLFSLYISFTRWDLITLPRWIGPDNYVELFTADRIFPPALRNTVNFTLGTVLPGLALALLFAVLLNQEIGGRFIYRAIYFVPVVAPTAAISILWAWIYQPNFGVLNFLLKSIGIKGPNWLGSPQWAMPAIIFMSIWQGLGYNIVLFLAGLQSISKEYFEAAAIDGANALQRFRHITMPLLSPVTFFALVLGLIGAFQTFTAQYVMTRGGPANATVTMVLYLYNQAFRNQHMGVASAIAYCIFVIVVGLTVANFYLQKTWVFYEEER